MFHYVSSTLLRPHGLSHYNFGAAYYSIPDCVLLHSKLPTRPQADFRSGDYRFPELPNLQPPLGSHRISSEPSMTPSPDSWSRGCDAQGLALYIPRESFCVTGRLLHRLLREIVFSNQMTTSWVLVATKPLIYIFSQ